MVMNNLQTILTFLLVVVVLFWIMPNKKVKVITWSLTSLIQVFPVSKICDALKEYFKTRNEK